MEVGEQGLWLALDTGEEKLEADVGEVAGEQGEGRVSPSEEMSASAVMGNRNTTRKVSAEKSSVAQVSVIYQSPEVKPIATDLRSERCSHATSSYRRDRMGISRTLRKKTVYYASSSSINTHGRVHALTIYVHALTTPMTRRYTCWVAYFLN
eukprot:695763-Amorphochlora_amoeboformis.AAC.1